MSEEYTNKELGIMLESLAKQVECGFKGVHERQDITNGKVMANTEWRLKSEGSLETMKWFVGFIGIGMIANIFVNLFK